MWKTAKLGDVCSFTRGLTYSKKDEVKHSHKSVLRATNIDLASYSLNLDDIRYISDSVIIKDDKLAKSGDILICTASGSKSHLGKVALITEDMKMAFGSFMGAIRTNTNCLPSFLFNMLITSSFKKYLLDVSGGTNINNLKFSQIRDYKFLLPPLREQKAIADVLSLWDEAIEKTERLIKAKQKRFRWLLRTLINDRIHHKTWNRTTLSESGYYYTGLSGKNKNDFGKGKPYLPYLNIFNNWKIDPKHLDYVSIQAGEKQNMVRKNDILFTTSSETPKEVGMSSILLDDIGECYLNSFSFGWRCTNERLLPEFLQFYFRSSIFRNQVVKLSQGATRFNLSKKELGKSFVIYPDIETQKDIAYILGKTREEISLLKQIVRKYRLQKRGLMQKLLTGEWRVKTKA